ncbi:GNAT family N-acetyltransferase [Pseudonocardia spinosispora]|uniref:GNAT family N-acetyltransferase n=1 Tax=Pseudonocardia spinosispora TaxID=103441 RepID=UPI00048D2FFC|nr:GNAT family N-acetyltransferase [Pseudonocardia spinosispora]
MEPVLRRATHDDLPAVGTADARAFGLNYTDQALEDFRPLFEPERFVLATDPAIKAVVGVAGSFSLEVTLPGGASVPTQGLTWVSVATTHRRQGVLRWMLTDMHQGFVEEGLALSLLMASEGGIYGRFGYGQASRARSVTIDRRLARVRPDARGRGGVRFVDSDEARALAPDVHRRWVATTPGALHRDDRWWDFLLLDREADREGGSALFFLLHTDGYVAYRIQHSDNSCRVEDFFAVTDEAHAALWHTLLGLDLVHTVTSVACSLDDPLPFLLEDPRQVRTTGVVDGLWARILDVGAALSARPYATDIDVVLDVADPLPGLGGRYRLRGGPEGASCERVTTEPDVRVDIASLSTLLFGAHRARTLARAGLVVAEPSVVNRVDLAFAGEREARHGTDF